MNLTTKEFLLPIATMIFVIVGISIMAGLAASASHKERIPCPDGYINCYGEPIHEQPAAPTATATLIPTSEPATPTPVVICLHTHPDHTIERLRDVGMVHYGVSHRSEAGDTVAPKYPAHYDPEWCGHSE